MDKFWLLLMSMIMKFEGGLTADIYDPGGITNYGVTEVAARENGFVGDMKDMELEDAIRIYREGYWLSSGTRYPQIYLQSPAVTLFLFDSHVLHGQDTSARWLQKAINAVGYNAPENGNAFLTIDGAVGSHTLKGLESTVEREQERYLLKHMRSMRLGIYYDLIHYNTNLRRFLGGWINRTHSTFNESIKLLNHFYGIK